MQEENGQRLEYPGLCELLKKPYQIAWEETMVSQLQRSLTPSSTLLTRKGQEAIDVQVWGWRD